MQAANGVSKAPLIQIKKRPTPSALGSAMVPLVAILFALITGSLLIIVAGLRPTEVYAAMVDGVLRSRSGLIEVGLKLAPILLASLGIALAFRGSFWNIGAEGQIYAGAIAAFGVGSALGTLPRAVVLPAVILAGFAGGALWGAVPAVLKSRFQTNEIVTTLMMNYIAMFFLFYLVHGPWKEPAFNYPWSWELPASAVLPRLGGTRIHIGVILALIALVAVYVLDRHTFWGYEIRFIGANRKAAEGAGIRVTRAFLLLMVISGGLAGLAGMGEVCGLRLRLLEEISLGYGFTAITAALLGRLNPFGVAISSLFLAVLAVGGAYVQRAMNIPFSFIEAISALLVLGVLLGRFLPQYRIIIRGRGAQLDAD